MKIVDLENETIFMVREKLTPKNYDRMEGDFKFLDFTPKKIEQVQNFDTMLLMVEAGAGIAFVPSYIKNNASSKLMFYPVKPEGQHFTHKIAAIYLKSFNNELITLFLQTAKSFFIKLQSNNL